MLALACVVLLGMILAALLTFATQVRSADRADAMRVQAAWLAEAGVERAAARLAVDPDYRGEDWSIEAKRLNGHDAALVGIRVGTIPDRERLRRIQIEAHYPIETPRRNLFIKDMTIDLSRLNGREEDR